MPLGFSNGRLLVSEEDPRRRESLVSVWDGPKGGDAIVAGTAVAQGVCEPWRSEVHEAASWLRRRALIERGWTSEITTMSVMNSSIACSDGSITCEQYGIESTYGITIKMPICRQDYRPVETSNIDVKVV
jgi:hypothetical protein